MKIDWLPPVLKIPALAILTVLLSGSLAGAQNYSWEGGADEGWYGLTTVVPVAVDVAGGAPAAAITDGDYALQIGRPDGAAWTAAARIDHVSSPFDFRAAMRENTTIDLDLFIPTESYSGGWAGFEFQIQGQEMTGGLTLKTQINKTGPMDDPVGESFHLTWEYNPEVGSAYNTDTNWAQFTIALQGGGTMNPIYVDNFQFSGAPGTPGDFDGDLDVDGADFLEWQRDPSNLSLTDWQTNYGTSAASATLGAVPEPSTLVLLAAASCAGLLGRRRIR